MNKIYILGIGPGHRDYLLRKTEQIIEKSDVLIGGSRALKMFSDLEKEKIKITADLEKIKNYILASYNKKIIAVLVSGDPGLYSMMNYLKRHIDNNLLEVIPGISSLQLATARIQMNWNDMKITSLHGNNNKEKVLEDIKNNKKVGLLTDYKFTPDLIAEFLVDKGIKNRQVTVFERLSYPDERIAQGTLREIEEYSFSNLTVMVICNE